jgi:brefeldin A-inhibited guanine nucleotide-exchange protein
VLHAYVDGLDFSGMLFDEAIRKYLSGFRLPGEAQKIDRMMEKFAERYCLQNQGVFPSPDTAFILAFSIIMLNTDLHNPAIKEERKMNKPGFISNNRGISSGKDLDDHFLGCIFDRIKEAPISLREDDLVRVGRRQPSALFSSTWRRPSLGVDASAFQRETDDMLKVSDCACACM